MCIFSVPVSPKQRDENTGTHWRPAARTHSHKMKEDFVVVVVDFFLFHLYGSN